MLLCQGQSFGFGFPVGDEPCCMVMKRVTVCIHPLFFCEFRSRREFGFGFVFVFGAGVDALGLLWVVAAANAQKRTQHHINTSRLAETKLHTGRHTATNNNETSAQPPPTTTSQRGHYFALFVTCLFLSYTCNCTILENQCFCTASRPHTRNENVICC